MHNPHLSANRSLWDEWTDIHEESAMYDVPSFLANRENRLKPPELEALPDVAGKSLLHLQCHFGIDTLSWAMMGAKVTGADFSPKAVTLARKLAAELKLDARFVEGNLYDLPEIIDDRLILSSRRTASSAGCRISRAGPRSPRTS